MPIRHLHRVKADAPNSMGYCRVCGGSATWRWRDGDRRFTACDKNHEWSVGLERSATCVEFLTKMGKMYRGEIPLSHDCRSTVVKWMLAHPKMHWNGCHIMVYGHKGERDVVHVILVDDHDRVLADAYNPPKPGASEPARGGDTYLMRLASGNEYLDCVDSVEVPHFLNTYVLRKN